MTEDARLLLIVEDEIYSRKSLVKQVQALDAAKTMTILEAADGKAALELVKRERPERAHCGVPPCARRYVRWHRAGRRRKPADNPDGGWAARGGEWCP